MIVKFIAPTFIAVTCLFSTGYASIAGTYQCVDSSKKDQSVSMVIKHLEGNYYSNDWTRKINDSNSVIHSGTSRWVVIGNKGISHWAKMSDKNPYDKVGISEISIANSIITAEIQSLILNQKGELKKEQFVLTCKKL